MIDETESTASDDVFVFLVNEEKSMVSSIDEMSNNENYPEGDDKLPLSVKHENRPRPNNILTPRSINVPYDTEPKYPTVKHEKSPPMEKIYEDDMSSRYPSSPTSVVNKHGPFSPQQEENQEGDEALDLFSLICKEKWSSALRYLARNKEEASFWVIQENHGSSRIPPRLPLHQACALRAPKEVIKALVDAYPKGVMSSEIFGALPLHLACQNKAPLGSIRVLLRAYPKATTVAVGGLLPIHMASMGHNVSLAVVEALIRVYPDGRDARDKHGFTPLTYYEMSSCPQKEWGLKMVLSHEPKKWRRQRLRISQSCRTV